MPDLDPVIQALHLRNWYAFAALLLTVVLQVVRKIPATNAVWSKVKDGWKAYLVLFVGAATGFTTAFASGLTLPNALLAAVGGALGISTVSMGLAAALKESHLPWDGGAGGKDDGPPTPRDPSVRIIPPRKQANPLFGIDDDDVAFSGLRSRLLMPALLLVATAFTFTLSACTQAGAIWPAAAKCLPDLEPVVADVRGVFERDDGAELSGKAVTALEELAKKYGPDAIVCAANELARGLFGAGAAPTQAKVQFKARQFVSSTGTRVEGQ